MRRSVDRFRVLVAARSPAGHPDGWKDVRVRVAVPAKRIRRGPDKMPRRRWTAAEIERLRSLYPTHTAVECAAELRWPVKAIYGAVERLGLEKQGKIAVDGRVLATIARRNGEGVGDCEIATELGCSRHTVSRHRKRMGLPSHAYGQRFRDRQRIGAQRQCERWGVESIGELRSLTFRIRSLRVGWPPDLRPRHVEILGLLETRGPMTRREIADALGLPWHGSRHSLKSNDPEGSYLAHLMARGLVIQLGRVVNGRGSGSSVHLYDLAIGAQRRQP